MGSMIFISPVSVELLPPFEIESFHPFQIELVPWFRIESFPRFQIELFCLIRGKNQCRSDVIWSLFCM